MKLLFALFLAILSASQLAFGQAISNAAASTGTEVAVQYSYVRSNAPPGGCGCFSLNGGAVSVAQPIRTGRFAFAVDADVAHGTAPRGFDLTLSAFTGGVRYRPMPGARWNPFGEVLVGAAHAGGSLASGAAPAASNSSLVFASTIGGGLDRKLGSRWSLRLVEADYLSTTYNNGLNSRENNLRLSAGVAYHFGKR
jgi:outer membrane immunogenic protein